MVVFGFMHNVCTCILICAEILQYYDETWSIVQIHFDECFLIKKVKWNNVDAIATGIFVPK